MPLFAHAVFMSMLILGLLAKLAAGFRRVAVCEDRDFAGLGKNIQAEAALWSTDRAGQLRPQPQKTPDTLVELMRENEYNLFQMKPILQDKSQWPADLRRCQLVFQGSSTGQALTEFLGSGKNGMVFAAGDEYAVKMLLYDEEAVPPEERQSFEESILADMKRETDVFEKIRISHNPTSHINNGMSISQSNCPGLPAFGMQRVHGLTLRQYKQSSGLGWTWRFVKQVLKETLLGICELRQADVVDVDRRIDNVIVEVAAPECLLQRQLKKLTFIDVSDFSDEFKTRRLAPDMMTELKADRDGWHSQEAYEKFLRAKEWLEGDEYQNQGLACEVAAEAPVKLEEFGADEAPDSLSGVAAGANSLSELLAKNCYDFKVLEPLLKEKANWPDYLKNWRFEVEGSRRALTRFLHRRKTALVFAADPNYMVKIYMHETKVADDIRIEESALEKIGNSPGSTTHVAQSVKITPPNCGGLPVVATKPATGLTLAQYLQEYPLQYTWNFVKQIIQETLRGACELQQAGVIEYYRHFDNKIIELDRPENLLERQLTKLTFIHLKDMPHDPNNMPRLMPEFMPAMCKEGDWISQAEYGQFLGAKAWLEKFPDQSQACDVADKAPSKLDTF